MTEDNTIIMRLALLQGGKNISSVDFGTEMSFKTLRIFTALSVGMNGYPQNQTDCATFIKVHKFLFEFLFALSPKHNQSVWEISVTRRFTKLKNFCLLKKNVSGCMKPVINITFPVISGGTSQFH